MRTRMAHMPINTGTIDRRRKSFTSRISFPSFNLNELRRCWHRTNCLTLFPE